MHTALNAFNRTVMGLPGLPLTTGKAHTIYIVCVSLHQDGIMNHALIMRAVLVALVSCG